MRFVYALSKSISATLKGLVHQFDYEKAHFDVTSLIQIVYRCIGFVEDYVGVFRNIQKELYVYIKPG